MAEANGALEQKRAWVQRVLKVEVGQAPGAVAAPPHHEAPDPDELRGHLNETGLRLRQLASTPGFAELSKRFAEAVGALKAQQWDVVETLLAEVNDQMAGQLSGARAKDAAGVIRAANAWRAAVASITTALTGFKSSVIAALEADEHEPEEVNDVSGLLDAEIADITTKLSDGLASQVDAVINGAPERRAAGMATILKVIQSVETQIVSHEGIDAIEDNGVIPIQIREPVKAALNDLRAALSEAAGPAKAST